MLLAALGAKLSPQLWSIITFEWIVIQFCAANPGTKRINSNFVDPDIPFYKVDAPV